VARSRVPARKRVRLLRYARRARRHGVPRGLAWTIAAEAYLADIPLALGYALIEQETGFRNVFGHDPTIFVGAGQVTHSKYAAYKAVRRASGNRQMQGVGPAQLTWWATQDEADRLGGCWRAKYNVRVGFRTLAANIRQNGLYAGVAAYNGSGAAAKAYARSVLAKEARWHRVLT
jgi:hypothetical protein